MTINRQEIIKKYIDFFKSKNHKQIPNSPLIPENDPTVLFTTAGMHPLVPYLLGQKHPLGKRLCNVQKCIRTQDIDEVGDSVHLTFFEMLGNWSLGDYFKQEAIKMSFEFLTKVLKIPIEKLAVSCFKGDKDADKDVESAEIWMSLGIPKQRIAFMSKSDNWWGPAGKTGPCGPDTEMFYWKGKNKAPEKFNPENNKWVEIWNDVFMQYVKDDSGDYNPAKQKNVDTGMGVERTVTILNGLDDVYKSSVFKPIIEKIELLSKHKYNESEKIKKSMRIIADHIKASCFIISDGITPSNTEQGYVLRRLIRRAVRYGRELGIEKFTDTLADAVFPIYSDYKHLQKKKKQIKIELKQEEENFLKTLKQGIKIFENLSTGKKKLSGKDAFLLYQSYGFPLEITQELAKEKGIKVDVKGFRKEEEKHQELSRQATKGKFKSGLADNTEQTKKLHTATHLLNQALKQVLNDHNIHQQGSNITPERLRFDFNFPRKLTSEELKKIENLVNEKINQAMPVECDEMSIEQAKKTGAEGIFGDKYKDLEKLKVYSVGDFSKEICAGPHVDNTKQLGKFKIIKEESSSKGVRRIKAILE